MSIITVPFGYLLSFLYDIFLNYGVALTIFTVIIKILLLPLSYKQQKSMAKTQKLNPELQELQKKYKNDKEKLNKEMMDLYKRHGASPVAGCLPLLLQFPIMIGLYQVIMRPLTYMYQVTGEQLGLISEKLGLAANTSEIAIAKALTPDIVTEIIGREIPIINFGFLGLDLAATPNWQVPSFLWLIPILSGLSTYASSKFSQKLQPPTNANASANTMMMLFPLMSVFFCFSLPAGVGFYWILSSLTAMLQQWGLTLYFDYKEKKNPTPVPPAKKAKVVNDDSSNESNDSNTDDASESDDTSDATAKLPEGQENESEVKQKPSANRVDPSRRNTQSKNRPKKHKN